MALSGSGSGQSAAWSNVSPGTYTVVVVCSNGSTAGTQSVVVFSELYGRLRDVLQDDLVVTVRGRLSRRPDDQVESAAE